MIELGGNITLDGFSGRDYAELIVVKKIVGRYARKISDTHAAFDSLGVHLQRSEPGSFVLQTRCKIGEQTHEATGEAQNLFIALDMALKNLTENK